MLIVGKVWENISGFVKFPLVSFTENKWYFLDTANHEKAIPRLSKKTNFVPCKESFESVVK